MPSQKRELMYNHDGVGKSYMEASGEMKELFKLCKIRGWANAFHRVFENKSALGADQCVDAEFDHGSKLCIIKSNESPRIAAIRLLKASKIDANGENITQCEQGIIKAIHIIFGTRLRPKEDFSEESAFQEHDGLAPANTLARKLFADGRSGFLWDDAIKIETTNHNQKPMKKTTMNGALIKTMYDSHTDGTGVCTPIFMLEDEHLERIIAGKTKQFANIRAKMSDAPKSTDPMIAAMGKSQKWSAEDLQTHTKSRLLEMHPYIAEALVRSKSSLVQASIDAMQLIANRQERVTPPAEVPLIELEEESF